MNSLYFTAVQLLLDLKDGNGEPKEYQMNQWTFDNLKDEVTLLSPSALVLCECTVENPYVAKLLDVPVMIMSGLRDTEIILTSEDMRKPTIDNAKTFVVRL